MESHPQVLAPGADVKVSRFLMAGPEVRAILAGRKTEVRRALAPQPPDPLDIARRTGSIFSIFTDRHAPDIFRVAGPVGVVRDVMGRAPEWPVPTRYLDVLEEWGNSAGGTLYRADDDSPAWCDGHKWLPATTMADWACRIRLEVTHARVEQLQDIDTAGCRAEGVEPRQPRGGGCSIQSERHRAVLPFAQHWDAIRHSLTINMSWAENPWVMVMGIKRVSL